MANQQLISEISSIYSFNEEQQNTNVRGITMETHLKNRKSRKRFIKTYEKG